MDSRGVLTGLILEGGGMRAVYTAGVLDCLLDNNIHIKHCYGVSAGSICGMNYIARQKERTLRNVVDYLHHKDYCSIRSLITTGNLFGVDMLYNRIPNELDPFDYQTFQESDSRLTVVLSDVASGRAFYRIVKNMKKDIVYIQGSCALPIVSKMVSIGGSQYLDGGITDSIPLAKAMQDGCTKSIVVLTQHREYQKLPEGPLPNLIGNIMYKSYPFLIKAGRNRHVVYNRQLQLVKQEEKKGNVLVICPREPVNISRIEKDKKKLHELYQRGYEDGKNSLTEIKNFCKR